MMLYQILWSNAMPNIIVNLDYRPTQYAKKLNVKEKKLQVNTKKAYDYYNRDNACDKTLPLDKKSNDIDTQRAFNYYSYRIGSAGSFTQNEYLDSKQLQSLADRYKPDYIYRMVVSFERDFALQTGIIEKDNIVKLVRKSMNSVLKQMKLNPDNVIWSAAYHTNTSHPHCHITIYEKEKTRKLYRLNKKDLNKLRGHIVSQLELNVNLYIRKDSTFNELIDAIKVAGMDVNSQKLLFASFNNSTNVSKEIKDISTKMIALNKVLPKEGSMKYNSKNIQPYHEQIKDIVNDILNLENVKPFLRKYEDVLNEIKQMQKDIYGDGTEYYKNDDGEIVTGVAYDLKKQEKYFQNRMKELETRVGNLVLQNILCARKDFKFEQMKFAQELLNINQNKIKEDKEIIKQTDSLEEIVSLYFPKQNESFKKKIKKTKRAERVQQKKNFIIRSNNISHKVVQELAFEIKEIYYASLHDKQMVNDVTRAAQNEIYAKCL